MSTTARALLEFLARDGSGYRCFAEYFPPGQAAALQLYSLSGLKGSDPPYRLTDLSLLAKDRLERDQDIISSEPIKLETDELDAAIGRWTSDIEMDPTLLAALEALRCLGPKARLVSWMRI